MILNDAEKDKKELTKDFVVRTQTEGMLKVSLARKKVSVFFFRGNIISYFCTQNIVIMKYNRIKEVLASKGIKQTWLAEKLGKTYRMVNSYVSNDVQPPIPVLYEIAEILQVEPKDLLEDIQKSKHDAK